MTISIDDNVAFILVIVLHQVVAMIGNFAWWSVMRSDAFGMHIAFFRNRSKASKAWIIVPVHAASVRLMSAVSTMSSMTARRKLLWAMVYVRPDHVKNADD